MAIKERKIYLTDEEWKKLKEIAIQSGFNGKGFVSHFIRKITNEPIVFLDKNVREMVKVLLPRLEGA